MTGAAFVVGIAFWHLRRATKADDVTLYLRAVRTGAAVLLAAGLGVAISGDAQGKVMTDVQPMKMAAAEGLYDTESSADFSLLTIGSLDGSHERFAIKIPGLLSFLGTGHTDGTVEGINQLRAEYQETYGQDPGEKYYSPGDYTPIIPLTYWTFRIMIGLGLLGAAFAAWILVGTRRRRIPQGKLVLWAAIALPFLPLFANSFGWIFTEMGRQPWAVFGLMTTAQSVSPGVSTFEAATSLLVLALLYSVLGVVEVKLLFTYLRKGADEIEHPGDSDAGADKPLAFAY
jgi:cytochrome d ubiquinol oxidase subunit I